MIFQGKKLVKILLVCCISIPDFLFSQSGGDGAYDYLNLTNSARVASLGGQQISLFDNDMNLVFHNPSLLTPEMHNNMILNYVNYFAGVNYGYVAYGWQPQKPYTLGAGIHYIYYGEFDEYDASAQPMGTFRAADYALNLYYSRPIIDSILRFGVNVKPLYSDLETYTSFGMAIDAGITYHNAEKLFAAALVFKNAGVQIKKYYPDQEREKLPFEIQLAITQQLKHAPFRFSVLAQHLQEPNLRFRSEIDSAKSIDPLTGDYKTEDPLATFADNVMRHLIFGAEFIPTQNFSVNFGYNYKRRMEMKLDNLPGMVGFSWGFGLKVSKFHISYGRSSYHAARGSNHFSILMNLSEFGTKL